MIFRRWGVLPSKQRCVPYLWYVPSRKSLHLLSSTFDLRTFRNVYCNSSAITDWLPILFQKVVFESRHHTYQPCWYLRHNKILILWCSYYGRNSFPGVRARHSHKSPDERHALWSCSFHHDLCTKRVLRTISAHLLARYHISARYTLQRFYFELHGWLSLSHMISKQCLYNGSFVFSVLEILSERAHCKRHKICLASCIELRKFISYFLFIYGVWYLVSIWKLVLEIVSILISIFLSLGRFSEVCTCAAWLAIRFRGTMYLLFSRWIRTSAEVVIQRKIFVL